MYIPIRDRSSVQLNRCVKFLKKNNLGLIGGIILVDIGSKKPVKQIKGTKLLRLETDKWNKAWGLNCAIKKYPNKYIMTVDLDMLLDKEHFLQISKNLHVNSFIIDTNVRRIESKDIQSDYIKMAENSRPWHAQDIGQFFNRANGGIQLYSIDFFTAVNGIQESLGLYHGSVDNVMVYRARMWSMNIVDLSHPLLHVEHSKKKEENYSKDERAIAQGYREFKSSYLNHIIQNNINRNPEKIGCKEPNTPLFKEFLNIHGKEPKIIQDAIKRGEKEVMVGYRRVTLYRMPSILICVINNYGSLPSYFVWDLIALRDYTSKKGIDVQIQEVSSANVAHMRNIASDLGKKGGFDFVVSYDVDHRMAPESLFNFIEKMNQNNWPILTPLTPSRIPPYYNTQYKEFKEEMNTKENTIHAKKPINKVVEIAASGPVGMVIRTEVFDKVGYPYYYEDYFMRDGQMVRRGSDLTFCKKLNEAKIPIRCDLSVSLPHEILTFANRGELIPAKDIYVEMDEQLK